MRCVQSQIRCWGSLGLKPSWRWGHAWINSHLFWGHLEVWHVLGTQLRLPFFRNFPETFPGISQYVPIKWVS